MAPAQLFYDFDLERHVSPRHMLREIDRFLDVDRLREALRPFCSQFGHPSIDPELIVRMLVIGLSRIMKADPTSHLLFRVQHNLCSVPSIFASIVVVER